MYYNPISLWQYSNESLSCHDIVNLMQVLDVVILMHMVGLCLNVSNYWS